MIKFAILIALFSLVWIVAVLIDNRNYYYSIEKVKRRERLAKEKAKRGKIELKWPENLPRHDLY